MNTHSDKATESKSQAVANSLSKHQTNVESTPQFVDNRPEAIAQKKLQMMVKNSSRVKQLRAYQETVDNKTIQRVISLEYDDETGEEEHRAFSDEDLFAHLTETHGLPATNRLLKEIMKLDAAGAIFSDTDELIDVLSSRGALEPDPPVLAIPAEAIVVAAWLKAGKYEKKRIGPSKARVALYNGEYYHNRPFTDHDGIFGAKGAGVEKVAIKPGEDPGDGRVILTEDGRTFYWIHSGEMVEIK